MSLSGFTLFKVPKGWQLSTREEGETGWIIRMVSEDKARLILKTVDPVIDHVPAEQPKPKLIPGQLSLRPRRDRVLL